MSAGARMCDFSLLTLLFTQKIKFCHDLLKLLWFQLFQSVQWKWMGSKTFKLQKGSIKIIHTTLVVSFTSS